VLGTKLVHNTSKLFCFTIQTSVAIPLAHSVHRKSIRISKSS